MDVLVSFLGILLCAGPILILILIATISTKKNGLYSQERIGLEGKVFLMFKIRSMNFNDSLNSITTKGDPRVTSFGRFLRKYKLDELPQLWNVLKGDMSLVGPRPDVPGYADKLHGDDRIILSVRPGITGPATLKYRNEEALLAGVDDPIKFNNEVIWKDKIKLNKEYIKNWSLKEDFSYIYKTIFS